jgi:hypothetical protein
MLITRRVLLASATSILGGCATVPDQSTTQASVADADCQTSGSPVDAPLPPEFTSYRYRRRGAQGSDVVVEYSLSHPVHALPADLAILVPTALSAANIVVEGTVIGRLNPYALTDPPERQPVPAHVQTAAIYAAHVMRVFAGAGFRMPARDGDQVLRLRFARDRAFVHPSGETQLTQRHIRIHHGLRGERLLLTIAHEAFHRIQYQYGIHMSCRSPSLFRMIQEGGARFAERIILWRSETFDMDGRDFFRPNTPPLSSWSDLRDDISANYSAVIFWRYLGSQHGRDRGRRGIDVLRLMLEEAERSRTRPGGPTNLAVLRRAHVSMTGHGSFDLFEHEANLPTTTTAGPTTTSASPTTTDWIPRIVDGRAVISSETTFGNFAIALALNGTAGSDSRFRLEGSESGSNWIDSQRLVVPAERTINFTSLPEAYEAQTDLGSVAFSPARLDRGILRLLNQNPAMRGLETVPPLSVMAFQVLIPGCEDAACGGLAGPSLLSGARSGLASDGESALGHRYGNASRLARMLRIRFQPVSGGLEDCFVQVVTLDPFGNLIDVLRHDCLPIYRSDLPRWRDNLERLWRRLPGISMDRTIDVSEAGRIIIIVCARERGGDFQLRLAKRRDAPLVVASPWNAAPRTSFDRDPIQFAATWESPSVRFSPDRNDETGELQAASIQVMLRNQGDVTARDVTASFWVRRVNESTWRPINHSLPRSEPTVIRHVSSPKPIEPASYVARRVRTDVPGGSTSTIAESFSVQWLPYRTEIGRSGALVRIRIDSPNDANSESIPDIMHYIGPPSFRLSALATN